MAENKTKPTDVSVTAFIEAIPDPVRREDAKILLKMMQGATEEKPKMWGPAIVGFGSYHYKHDGGREGDMALISFSPRKASTALYSMGGFSGSDALRAKLDKRDSGKGCLNIKKVGDVDLHALETLIKKSAEAMRAKYPNK